MNILNPQPKRVKAAAPTGASFARKIRLAIDRVPFVTVHIFYANAKM